ncbi:MAG: nicotinamide riboside transporter PnuC [Oscillospiraceae bacterium]|nr:nicotinamide riboside transporter PnuC [Oscillospiraceae bacterium]
MLFILGGVMKNYFTKGEKLLWGCSAVLILAAFFAFDRANYLNLAASLVGITSLIFAAKANPIGQVLMIVFSLLYGVISFGFSYYGEMITYLGMTMPMSVISLISWLRNPFNGSKSEVKVNRIRRKEVLLMCGLALVVTAVFYFILKAFGTTNLVLSTLSVTTSFVAVYLTFRRSPFYAAGYAANDIVLIILWVLAARDNSEYVSVAVCFAAFLVNDLYGFINWRKIEKRQSGK